ncbi:PIN2/TERF1-interacting telomerase inhibitor 1 [Labrus bergylta]|uniref:PIN2/TERF1-interacting telomerase inhibitor 1 n=1 Tax=Labrus bergylta TaxID=56723 RepID=UPI0033133C84
MSMLAEPKRKQKWSVDPRNSAWSKDDSKFGQKMLERMGWSKGKGLGRSEQGSTDHIKVKVKNNNYGLGTSASYEDNWIAHQDDFNELLAQLNNCHGQNNTTVKEPPSEEQKGFSLEAKSKTSKKRVHYMKFTKGKDLSSRTETDLNCIFGKRGRSAKEQEQENSSDSQSETEKTVTLAPSELDTESITKTLTSTLTMQEYFAQRMAQLKKARGQAQNTEPLETEEANETSSPSDEPDPILASNDDSEEPKKKKKKKKKKKSKKSSDELEVEVENVLTPIVIEDDEDQEHPVKRKKSKKSSDELEVEVENVLPPIVIEDDEDQEQEHPVKRKKRKLVESEEAKNETCSAPSLVEQNCEELPLAKKKKKHQKHSKDSELTNGHAQTEDEPVESVTVHKKKKKHREDVDSVVIENNEELVEKKSKKDKKKKKKHQE